MASSRGYLSFILEQLSGLDGKEYRLGVRDLCAQAKKAGIDYRP